MRIIEFITEPRVKSGITRTIPGSLLYVRPDNTWHAEVVMTAKKNTVFRIVLVVLALSVLGIGSVQGAPTTLFRATHQGQNQGNWNVGLFKYNGDGTGQTPVNSGGASVVTWGDNGVGSDNGLTHDFTLTYDPATFALSFTVVGGSKTVLVTTTSPVVPPAAVGPVNNLHMDIRATAGTSVSCQRQSSALTQQVNSSTTTVSNLALDGTPLAGLAVTANLADNPTSPSFTNVALADFPVPGNTAWTLTGKITVAFQAANMAFPPKQQRIGMPSLDGQYIEPPVPTPTATPTATPTVTPTPTATPTGAGRIAATGGTPQSALINTQFAQPLQVTVTDTLGLPVVGALVTFTAPVIGPSAALSNGGSATTDAGGRASVTATANGIVGGPYSVSATTGTLPPATFSLTNLQGAASPIPTLGGLGLLGFALLVLLVGAIVLTQVLTAGHP